MKKTITMGAMAIALLAAVSCSENETEIIPGPGNNGDSQIALGISANLEVNADTKTVTKSVVSGEKITYPADKYDNVDYAPGLGILVTSSDAKSWYTPDGTEYDGHHVWYMGDENGANWKSILTKGNSFALTNEIPYYLSKAVGKVYAYYPYNADLSLSTISSESDLKIPVSVLASGAEKIDASTNNAEYSWSSGTWKNTETPGPVLSLAAEKDYLYFVGTKGRYVNNGRADNQSPVTPEAGPDNKNVTNPGYKINLDMKHGLAMVSFRVYDGGHLSDNDVNFTKFEIKNHGSSSLFKTGDGKMSLVDGGITETSATTAMTREITGYTLMRQVDKDGTEGEHAFKATSTITGKSVSKKVGAIVYPIAGSGFSKEAIDVVITLKEGDKNAVEYPITLPANKWEANNNYIYTFSAGRNKLTITDVTVTAWTDQEQDVIPL